MDLFEHNKTAYEAVCRDFSAGIHRSCVVHPTGTGKSFIALQLIEDNKDKRILYVTSLNINLKTFKEHVFEVVGENSVDFSLYSSLEDYGNRNYDYIILDEFHRAGATDWSKGLALILENNPDAYILGLSATPIRYLDSARNMAEELFDGRIASEITLKEALVKKLLPMPHYMTAVYSFEEEFKKYEKKLEKRGSYQKRAERLLQMAKQNLELSDGLDQFFKQNMKNPKGKYLVFCRNIEHLHSMMEEAEEWFSWVPDRHFYMVYSALDNMDEYEGFLEDDSGTLRLLFCVDMLNEGIHIEGIDGCIMLRPTTSLNVYYQQLGRVLTVCAGGTPEVYDIVKNSYLLKPVKHFWGEVRKEYEVTHPEEDVSEFFTIYSRDIAIIKLLEEFDEAMDDSWMYYYGLCERYYDEFHNLNVSFNYRSDGHVLYVWVNRQKNLKRNNQLSQERIDLLELLEIDWEFQVDRTKWENKFEALVQYKEEHGDLNVVLGYVTDDGFPLGKWCKAVRSQYRRGELSADKVSRFEEIGFEWKPIDAEVPQRWMNGYNLLKKYVEENGDTMVPADYIQDEFKLGQWMTHVKYQYKHRDDPDFKKKKLNEAQIRLLKEIGFDIVDVADKREQLWEDNYQKVKQYYDENGCLPSNDNQLSRWLTRQKSIYNGRIKGTLTQDRIKKLETIGFQWKKKQDIEQEKWMLGYSHAKKYYSENGNLQVPLEYIIDDFKLGNWIKNQRNHAYRLSQDEKTLLNDIGMIWAEKANVTEYSTGAWDKKYKYLFNYWLQNGNVSVPPKYKCEDGTDLYVWCSTQRMKRRKTEKNRKAIESGDMKLKLEFMLSDYQIQKLDEIGFEW